MFLSSFPESPAFESLLNGSYDVDLLSVLGEVGGCDLVAIECWLTSTARNAGNRIELRDDHSILAVATRSAGLRINDGARDGRVASTAATGTGWALAVAILEQRLLEEIGVESELVEVLGEVFLRVDSPSGLLFHPSGSLSVWVDEAVAVGFLVAKFGVEANDLRLALTRGRVRSKDRRFLVSRYLKSVCVSGVLAGEAALAAHRQLAALEPGNHDHWLDVARLELACNRPASAFDLAHRLERAGHQPSAAIRREAEQKLATLN